MNKIVVQNKNKKNNKKNYLKDNIFLKRFFYSLLVIFLGIYLGMIIMSILGLSPKGLFISIFKGNFGNLKNFGNFISTFTWLCFIGLSLMVSFKSGIFNIGACAQMVSGGLFAYLFGAMVDLGNKGGMIICILIAIFSGVMIALLIAFLKNRFGINEVVSSIMVNWIVFWVYRYFRNPSNANYLFNGSTPKEVFYSNSLRMDWLTNLFNDSTINFSIIILIVIVPIIWFTYKKTSFGVKQKIIGQNIDTAAYIGIDSKKEIYKVMALSGGLAGLAGVSFYLGSNQTITLVSSDLPAEAFNGITISLIGFNSTIGVVFGAIVVSLFENSKNFLSVYSNEKIADLILSLIILILSISNYFILYNPFEKLKIWLKKEKEIKNKDKNKGKEK